MNNDPPDPPDRRGGVAGVTDVDGVDGVAGVDGVSGAGAVSAIGGSVGMSGGGVEPTLGRVGSVGWGAARPGAAGWDGGAVLVTASPTDGGANGENSVVTLVHRHRRRRP